MALVVEWASAYELMLSLSSFVTDKPHSNLELGPLWARSVQAQLPPEATNILSRKAASRVFKNDCDLLTLFVHACPGERSAAAFLDWFAQLTAGTAYEAVTAITPDSGPHLPRDFLTWRDFVLDMLGVWHAAYFRHLDPAILSNLKTEATHLKARIDTEPPLQLVEDVTNGIVVEPSPELQTIVLVPQFHQRPYNNHTTIQGGAILLYPCESAAPGDADLPPPRLMRLTRALSDDSRLRMLRFLTNGPRSLTEVSRFAGLSQPTVHHHLTQLRAAGLVRVHFAVSGPSRYSLRPHALEQLSQQLSTYLEVSES